MVSREEINLVDLVQFMVIKNLYVVIIKQVEIYFVAIISDSYDEGTFKIEGFYLLVEGQCCKIFSAHRCTLLWLIEGT